jgi:diaminopimelate decarboxylase
VTISGVILSMLSGSRVQASAAVPSPEHTALRRCEVYRKSFPMTEIVLPAHALRDRVVAKWVRDHRLAVDVRTGEDLTIAIAAGIHPSRITVHADGMSDSDLRTAVHFEFGFIAVSSIAQIELLARSVDHGRQGVVVRVTDVNTPSPTTDRGFPFDSSDLDRAVAAILAGKLFKLIGLHCDVGSQDHDFVSYPAAIGHMITEMTQVRRHHGLVLTRLGLGGGRAVPSGNWAVELPELAEQIEQSLDDACATLRFPRPLVLLSPGLAIVGENAA